MPRGISVLRHPEKYSKKRVERALNRQAARKKTSTVELAMTRHESNAALTRSDTVAEIQKHGRLPLLSFDIDGNMYSMGGLKIDMFDPDNAAEVVRRFNSGDA